MTPSDPGTPFEPAVAARILIGLILTAISVFMPVPSGRPVIDAIAPVCSVAAIIIWLLLYRQLGRAVFAGVAFAATGLVIIALPDVKLASVTSGAVGRFGAVPVIIVVGVLFALATPGAISALIRATRSRK